MTLEYYASDAVQDSLKGELVFCKFLSANDTGQTGGHQAGIYISKPSIRILFDEPGLKGYNKEKWVTVHWQGGLDTKTRFIYYGRGTRNEYRITNFGKGFPFLKPEYTGALFVFIKDNPEEYKGYILNTDDEIDQYLEAFGISPTETNKIINTQQTTAEFQEETAMDMFINGLRVEFPSSEEMSAAARTIYYQVYLQTLKRKNSPDQLLLAWTDEEYKLFRRLEYVRYGEKIAAGFSSVDDFVSTANRVLNRRKSRAGKSLEHHLAAIFDEHQIQYTAQAVTEGNKKPDFIFPSQDAYHDISFPVERLLSLAAKTTCKDRWRQVINEANRLREKHKYLCTLQQGISAAQMDEMQDEGVILVVPKPYISSYPKDRQERIWTLDKFISYVKEVEEI